MVMTSFQERVIEEQKELDIKLNKLLDFCDTDTFESLPYEERSSLLIQQNLMAAYSNVLQARIKRFV